MAEKNNLFIGLIGMMVIAAIAMIIALVVEIQLVTGPVGTAIVWFAICFICYFGVSKAFPAGEKVSPISILFILLWVFVVLGLILGILIFGLIDTGSSILDLDKLVNDAIIALPISLGPTFAAALGISNSTKYN